LESDKVHGNSDLRILLAGYGVVLIN